MFGTRKHDENDHGYGWYAVTKTLLSKDNDAIRTVADSIAPKMDGCILLLVRHGDEPVREYLRGDGRKLIQAGEQAGFKLTWVDEDDDSFGLPDKVTRSAHPLVPWSVRLNSISNMERLRTKTDELHRSLEASLPPNSYVSVRFRKRDWFEERRIRNWTSAEHNATEDGNELLAIGTMVARVSAGCETLGDAKDLARTVGSILCPRLSSMSAHASRPKLMLPTVGALGMVLMLAAWALSPQSWMVGVAATGAALLTCLIGLLFNQIAHANIQPMVIGLSLLMAAYGWLLLLPCEWWWSLPFAVFTVAGVLRRVLTSRENLLWDDVEQKPRHYVWLSPERSTEQADQQTKLGIRLNESDTLAYPAQRSTMIVTPVIVVAAITPESQAEAMVQQSHPVPEALSHGGVRLGVDQHGRNCYLVPDQLHKGVGISGEQGSGKSVVTYGLMQWGVLHREDTTPRVWGEDSRIVNIQMKDDHGVKAMDGFYRKHGIKGRGLTTYLADERTPTIDLLGMLDGKDAYQTALSVARAMQYSFEKGDIQNDSLDVITMAMTIGIAAERYELRRVALRRKDPSSKRIPEPLVDRIRRLEPQFGGADQAQQQQSPIGWALMALCGSSGQAGAARALGQVCRAIDMESKQTNRDMRQAAEAAEQLYGRPDKNRQSTVSNQRLLDKTNASRNKIRQFMSCEHIFTPRRARITWRSILENPGEYNIVVAAHEGRQLPENMDKILGAWLMFRMWNTMTETCQNWQKQGKHVMLVCDELSLLANADDRILCSLHEQGRSFGLILVLATQYLEQLTPNLLRSFKGYGTLITFNTTIDDTAKQIAAQLTDNDGADGWTAGVVKNLPSHCAAVRTRTEQQLQPTFLCQMHNFEDEPI